MTKIHVPPGAPLATDRSRLRSDMTIPPLMAGIVSSFSLPTATATASATPHTKGAWTQIIASTPADTTLVHIIMASDTFSSGADTSTLLDVGVGGSGSEVAVISDIAVGWRQRANTNDVIPVGTLPIWIPRGSRVSIRVQSVVASKTAAVRMMFMGQRYGERPPATLQTYGVVSASSRGTNLAAGSASKTAWTQLVASTTQPLRALVVGVQGGADTTMSNGNAFIDIGVGGAGSEVVLIPDLWCPMNSQEVIGVGLPGPYAVSIPAGSRIAARWMESSGNLNVLDVSVIGVPA